MAFCAGRSEAVSDLARRLAPGRQVKRITLDFPVKGIVTATIEVSCEEDDMPLVLQAVEECAPDVTIMPTGESE
jgi:hypothetical protein